MKYLWCLALMVIFGCGGEIYAQLSAAQIEAAAWQYSVSDAEKGKITFGIRNKWGGIDAPDAYKATFVLTTRNKKTFRAQANGEGDGFVYVTFPDDFKGKLTAGETGTVRFYVNGIYVTQAKFKFRG